MTDHPTDPTPPDTAPEARDEAIETARARVMAGVVAVIREQSRRKEKEEVGLAERLNDDLGLDSLGMADILLELEDRFEIVIPSDDADRWVSVSDAVNYCARRVAEKGGEA